MDSSTQRNQVDAFHKSVMTHLPQFIKVYGVNYRLHAQKALHGEYSLVYYSFDGKRENSDNKLFDKTYHFDRSVEQVIEAYLKELKTVPFAVVDSAGKFTIDTNTLPEPVLSSDKKMKPKDLKIAELQMICSELRSTTQTLFKTKDGLLVENSQLKAEIAVLKAENQRINAKSLNLAEVNRLESTNAKLLAENDVMKVTLIQRDGAIREINRKINNARNLLNQI